MDSVTFDALDRRLLHALQLDGRAPFSRIAEVLDVSDRTLARRAARLRASGRVRVAGVADGGRLGGAEWLVRMRTDPAHAVGLARDLARRADTRWVTVLSGGTELTSIFRVADQGPAPLAALARHPRITDLRAHRLLRHLTDRHWSGRTSALTEAQIAELRVAPDGVSGPVTLTDPDKRLLSALAVDGRAACPELARQVGWSESAVRRRLAELRRSGVLRFDVEVDSALLGHPVQCLLWLAVSPGSLAPTAAALAADPETAYIGATTGTHNLLAVAVFRNAEDLYAYTTDRLGSLDGIQALETAPITGYAKRAAPPLPTR
ncbi:AsnC family transcriptional regulator [Kitasatospora sp. KL5]|uniref:AsnC family transcriptional regulator n=1 Tax=Kitasatospora sp. KL5 TaxID=3425125 RepID=UPI003D6EFE60